MKMNSQWITAQQAAENWNVSLRYVQRLLAEGRVPAVKKHGPSWLIPSNAKKPNVPLKERSPENSAILSCFSLMWDGLLPGQKLATLLPPTENAALRNQYLGEIAYLCGNFSQAKRFSTEALTSKSMYICASLFSLLAAISSNDFELYSRIDESLKQLIETTGEPPVAILAETVLATGAVCMFAPEMVPSWLKAGDFSCLPKKAVPFAMYLRIKYLQNLADYPQMFAVAQTMLTLCRGTSIVMDIYLLLMCAAACVGLDQKDQARNYLQAALALGMPHRFITPFVENVSTLNGLVEECVQQQYPQAYDDILTQWQYTWKNWAVFHNRFAQDNVPLLLNLREYRIATLAASRVPYARIAEQECISVGRVRNIMQEIYNKLFVRNRRELAALVLWLPKKT